MYTICCEAIFNKHPKVLRSALVGVGSGKEQLPVLIVELQERVEDQDHLFTELRHLALANPLTAHVTTFLVHPSFPVDIRHNAKIFREKLALWAGKQLHFKSASCREGL
jgi:acyl-coenzyme A synthetase/AMP-(fatty) acid ligase